MSNEAENKDKKEDPREAERKEAYRKSMLCAHINAYIQRGLNAGIPERYLRIGPDQFKSLLLESYHGKDEIDSITDFIYKKPLDLVKIPLIVIDGGKMKDRKLAAFAIMFRIITCDKFGKFYDCRSLVHKLNAFDARGVLHGERRTDFADIIKEYNVLCISEFTPNTFKEKLEGGDFIDEILDERYNNLNTTIVTFQDPISVNNALTDITCGTYLKEMSHNVKMAKNPSEDVLRIRVRSSENA